MTPDTSFEGELRSLRPRPPSPALRRGVARHLAGAPRWSARGALVGGLAAAGLLAAAVVWQSPPPPRVGPPIVPPVAAAGDQLPTLQAYRRALARSPDALEALLDEQARQTARAGAQVRSVRAFLAHTADF